MSYLFNEKSSPVKIGALIILALFAGILLTSLLAIFGVGK